MQLTIVVNMFDAHILNYPNNSMVLAMDFADRFHNDIFCKYRHYSVMPGYCLIQICEKEKKI